jgi:hypothetical protein
MNNPQKCPVCEGAATRSKRTIQGDVMAVPMPLSVSCDECGKFSMEEGFLHHGWSDVPAEAKQAIAAYLKETKGKAGYAREITANSWKRMASQGEKFLQARLSA